MSESHFSTPWFQPLQSVVYERKKYEEPLLFVSVPVSVLIAFIYIIMILEIDVTKLFSSLQKLSR